MSRVDESGRVPVVDQGRTLVETIGPWFVQDGPRDLDRVRFRPGAKVYVTADMAERLVDAGAVKRSAGRKPKAAPEDKARKAEEDKGAG